jgi:hypothetical protein
MNDGRAEQRQKEPIEMPASTAWPILLAFGVTLLFASLVMSREVGIAGFLLIYCGVRGWAKECLPEEHHEMIPVKPRLFTSLSVRTQVAHIQVSEVHRAFLLVESYAVTSGLRGGIAGGIVMIFPALLYGYLTQHSIWYPSYGVVERPFGIDALTDQVAVGAFMWVFGSLVFLVPAIYLTARLLASGRLVSEKTELGRGRALAQ